jgi:hypothetical protein
MAKISYTTKKSLMTELNEVLTSVTLMELTTWFEEKHPVLAERVTVLELKKMARAAGLKVKA